MHTGQGITLLFASNPYPRLLYSSKTLDFQVAAMTVFFLLAVAYYIFLAPFLWFTATVITAYAVYSPLVSIFNFPTVDRVQENGVAHNA